MPSETEADDTAVEQAISCDPNVMSGTLVFAGTRVPVDALIDNILDNMSVDEFLENFPTVERWQVAAVLRVGARSLGSSMSVEPKGRQ
ncbi:DUF433 domain-containing protein [Aureimonas sp. AU22]|uniref:DUF433 domain-containing protein n=1 Tax=Aureimonas sp. AU22 TaxID=1638162 RepID=UPI0007838253|nr:DUF433 domain-containing protein [Aureimonas sp. AU22]